VNDHLYGRKNNNLFFLLSNTVICFIDYSIFSLSFSINMNKFFNCKNGQNISWISVCDGFNQCIDGSDEQNCNKLFKFI
jgi:hypothetical protein